MADSAARVVGGLSAADGGDRDATEATQATGSGSDRQEEGHDSAAVVDDVPLDPDVTPVDDDDDDDDSSHGGTAVLSSRSVSGSDVDREAGDGVGAMPPRPDTSASTKRTRRALGIRIHDDHSSDVSAAAGTGHASAAHGHAGNTNLKVRGSPSPPGHAGNDSTDHHEQLTRRLESDLMARCDTFFERRRSTMAGTPIAVATVDVGGSGGEAKFGPADAGMVRGASSTSLAASHDGATVDGDDLEVEHEHAQAVRRFLKALLVDRAHSISWRTIQRAADALWHEHFEARKQGKSGIAVGRLQTLFGDEFDPDTHPRVGAALRGILPRGSVGSTFPPTTRLGVFDVLLALVIECGDGLNEEGKVAAVFTVIDADGSGKIERDEFLGLLASTARRLRLDLDNQALQEMTQTLFDTVDVAHSGSMTLRVFKALFKEHPALASAFASPLLRDVEEEAKARRSKSRELGPTPCCGRQRRCCSGAREALQLSWANHPSVIVWSGIYVLVCVAVFVWRFNHYVNDPAAFELMGYCIAVARGSSKVINVTVGVALWPVVRPVLTFLRQTWLRNILPFDQALEL